MPKFPGHRKGFRQAGPHAQNASAPQHRMSQQHQTRDASSTSFGAASHAQDQAYYHNNAIAGPIGGFSRSNVSSSQNWQGQPSSNTLPAPSSLPGLLATLPPVGPQTRLPQTDLRNVITTDLGPAAPALSTSASTIQHSMSEDGEVSEVELSKRRSGNAEQLSYKQSFQNTTAGERRSPPGLRHVASQNNPAPAVEDKQQRQCELDTTPAEDGSGSISQEYLASQRQNAKNFITAWHSNGYTFAQLVAENLDATFLRGIYEELGLDLQTPHKHTKMDGQSNIATESLQPLSGLEDRQPNANIKQQHKLGPIAKVVPATPMAAVRHDRELAQLAQDESSNPKLPLISKRTTGPDTNGKLGPEAVDIAAPTDKTANRTAPVKQQVGAANRQDYVARLMAAKSKKSDTPSIEPAFTFPPDMPKIRSTQDTRASSPEPLPQQTSNPPATSTHVSPTSMTEPEKTNKTSGSDGTIPSTFHIVSPEKPPSDVPVVEEKRKAQTELARLRIQALESARLSAAAKTLPKSLTMSSSVASASLPDQSTHNIDRSSNLVETTVEESCGDGATPTISVSNAQGGHHQLANDAIAESKSIAPPTTNGIVPAPPPTIVATGSELHTGSRVNSLGRIPGLFMTSPMPSSDTEMLMGIEEQPLRPTVPAPTLEPHAFTTRKRPVASDFDYGPVSSVTKRQFGQARAYDDYEGIVIEASEDESDSSDGELDMQSLPLGKSMMGHAPSKALTTSKISMGVMAAPLASEPQVKAAKFLEKSQLAHSLLNSPSSPAASPAPEILEMELATEVLKRKIAELEQRKKAKSLNSRAPTPSTPRLTERPGPSLAPVVLKVTQSRAEASSTVTPALEGFQLSAAPTDNHGLANDTSTVTSSDLTAPSKRDRKDDASTQIKLSDHSRLSGSIHDSSDDLIEPQPLLEKGTIDNRPMVASGNNADSDSDSDLLSDSNESMSLAESTPSVEPVNNLYSEPPASVAVTESAVLEFENVRPRTALQDMASAESPESHESGEIESDASSSDASLSSLPLSTGGSNTVAAPIAASLSTDTAVTSSVTEPALVSLATDASQRLFIGNLPYTATESELRTIFGKYSINLESVNIPTIPKTGRKLGYALVDVASTKEADDAMESLHETFMQDRKISVQLARPKGAVKKAAAPAKPVTPAQPRSNAPTPSTNVNGWSQDIARSPNTEESDDYEPPEAKVGSEPIEAMDLDMSTDSDSEYEPPDAVLASSPVRADVPDSNVVAAAAAIAGFSQHAVPSALMKEVAIDGVAAETQTTPASTRTSALPGESTILAQDKAFVPYSSPLNMFKSYRYHPSFASNVSGGLRSGTYSHNIDAGKPICSYEATGGVCNDNKCQGQHFKTMMIGDDEVLKQLGTANPGRTEEEKKKFPQGLRLLLNDLRQRNIHDSTSVASGILDYRRRFLDDPSRILNL